MYIYMQTQRTRQVYITEVQDYSRSAEATSSLRQVLKEETLQLRGMNTRTCWALCPSILSEDPALLYLSRLLLLRQETHAHIKIAGDLNLRLTEAPVTHNGNRKCSSSLVFRARAPQWQ